MPEPETTLLLVTPSNQVRARNAERSIQQTNIVKMLNASDNTDDDEIGLQSEEQDILKEFREQLRLCEDDDEKFKACTEW
jgi:hypothetical protein